jgi:anti-sigma factor RsiW
VSCDETANLLSPYLDGELDLVHSLAVEQHLSECAACAEVLRRQRRLRSALGDADLYHRAPDGLRARIHSALQGTAPPARHRPPRVLLALAASVALVALGLTVWTAWLAGAGPRAEERLAQEVVAGHVRSLLAAHLLDVASSDRHTVKPWFNGLVDFAPPVPDLADQGFPLDGGRLDYLDGRKAAALVYRRRRHVINLFIWPDDGPAAEPRPLTRQGYHLIHWAEAGLAYWAVSDLAEDELAEFARLVRQSP